MAIEMYARPGTIKSIPVVRCDHCRRLIVDANDGVYLWRRLEEDGALSPALFAHSDRCHEVLESSISDGELLVPWMPLSHFVACLAGNLRVSPNEVKDVMSRDDSQPG